MYTFEIGLRKKIQIHSNGHVKWFWYHDFEFENITISFRCVLCFISYNVIDNVKDFLSFDLGTEVFASTNLPYDSGYMMPFFWPQDNHLLVVRLR